MNRKELILELIHLTAAVITIEQTWNVSAHLLQVILALVSVVVTYFPVG